MSGPVRERCDECGYWISAHVASSGRFLGCPARVMSQHGGGVDLPRIAVRVGKAGALKDRVLVTWPDYLDSASGQIVVWDMGSGTHTVEDQGVVQRNSRRASRDLEHEMREEIEYQIGGKVRVVGGNWPTKGANNATA